MWEDPQNRDGGRWILNLDKKNRQTAIDVYWLNTLLGLIGDQFLDESQCVNGAVINLRAKLDKICLWTRCARDQETQNRIGYV
jgi:translation initiation factor 4E